MCGDGANDGPALRQAQMGIAVSTATDVAKSSAGIVLTEPGLAGVVASIEDGPQDLPAHPHLNPQDHHSQGHPGPVARLRSCDHRERRAEPDADGPDDGQRRFPDHVVIDGQCPAIAHPERLEYPASDAWPRSGRLRVLRGLRCQAKFFLGLDLGTLRTFTAATLVFSGQAVLYVARDRRHIWSSRPGTLLVACSVMDVGLMTTLADRGILMAPLHLAVLACLLASAAVFALVLDGVKTTLFRAFEIN